MYHWWTALLVAEGEELVEDDSEAPHVRGHRELALSEGLWGVPGQVAGQNKTNQPFRAGEREREAERERDTARGCSEPSSPEDGALARLQHRVVLLVLRQHLGQAKVPDLHPALALHQDVACGQVPVDVALRGQVVHPLGGRNTQPEWQTLQQTKKDPQVSKRRYAQIF